MRQTSVLVGAAGLTLGILLAGFLAFRVLTDPGGEAVSPTPGASAGSVEPLPSVTVGPSASAPATSATAAASASPSPTATATPLQTTGPSPVPGETITYTVKGSAYVDSAIPPGGAIANLAGGAIKMTTGTASSDELTVTYRLVIPAGRVVKSYQLKVCGSGSGNFWETYGPPGANPAEYEVVPPASDGCWHFAGGSMTDTTVLAIIGHGSVMRVDRVDYNLTFR